ncbi:MAG TPA: cytochrome P450 [Gemmataceae bacterium]|nr:cytochrome P450 [Gemmataceae bacterium]
MGILSLFSASRRSPQAINLASPQFKASPYDYYAKLRAESPIVRTTLPTGEPGWLISRYDDAVAVLKDERFVKDRANALTPAQLAREPWFRKLFRSLNHQMLSKDPPDHTRLRALVSQAFTPRLIEQMRDRIQALADELLEPIQARGRLDLIHDFALPLPSIVIAEMLGVPAKDRHAFHRWSTALLGAAQTKRHLFYAVPNVLQFMRYLRKLIAKRRAEPRNDLVSAMIQAEEAGDRLNPEELRAMTMLLLVAGHETTVNLIGNGMLALMQHPDQMEKLRRDPGLIRLAVEELLRFTCPVDFATDRLARQDVSMGGLTIPRGELVFVILTSANRDERQFPNPDKLDITREPNRHLAFGLGPHFCLGAPLARLEGQLAINTLLRRLPNLRLPVKPSELRWRRGLLLRGLQALPVEFDPTPSQFQYNQEPVTM